jgi:vitamin B12 transporter
VRIFSFSGPTHGTSAEPGSRSAPPRGAHLLSTSLLLVAALGSAPDALSGQHPGELRGRVVDALTGLGVAGARVTVPAAGREVLSDGDGTVYLRGLPPGEVEFRAERLGFRPGRAAVRVRNGEIARFELALVPEALSAPGIEVEVDRGGPTVLDRDAIRRSGARSAGDLVAGIPGVTVVRAGPGGGEEVRLRGGAGAHVLVLVDGAPVNDPVTGAADLSSLAASRIERVEVLPGARTARYGPGALAGVVLIETRRGEVPAEVTLRGGSLGERGAELAASRETGAEVLSAAAGARGLAGSFSFERHPSLGGGTDVRRNADVRERWLRVGAAGERGSSRWDAGVRSEWLERGIPGKSFAPSDSARESQAASTATARWALDAGDRTVSAHLYHRARDVRFRDPAPPTGFPFDDRTRVREEGATLRGELHGGQGGGSLGAELQAGRRTLRGDVLGTEGPVRTLDGTLAVHGELRNLRLPTGPDLHGALRLHRDGPTDTWLAAHELTLRLGGGRGRGALTGHVTWRSSFSPPSAGDLWFREGVGIAPNPDLRAERVPSELEVGASAGFRTGPGEVTLAGEVFGGDLRDMIVWTPDFRFTWSPRNVDVRRRGGEVRASLSHPASGLEATGHFSSTRATYLAGGGTPGVQVVYRPRDTAGFAVAWRRPGVHARLQGRYTGLRYPVRAAANALDPFWTVELAAGGEVGVGGWTVEPVLRVDRLLDERHPFIHSFPEPGRTVHLEARLRRGPPQRAVAPLRDD